MGFNGHILIPKQLRTKSLGIFDRWIFNPNTNTSRNQKINEKRKKEGVKHPFKISLSENFYA